MCWLDGTIDDLAMDYWQCVRIAVMSFVLVALVAKSVVLLSRQPSILLQPNAQHAQGNHLRFG